MESMENVVDLPRSIESFLSFHFGDFDLSIDCFVTVRIELHDKGVLSLKLALGLHD